jgi:hypothetical protein
MIGRIYAECESIIRAKRTDEMTGAIGHSGFGAFCVVWKCAKPDYGGV